MMEYRLPLMDSSGAWVNPSKYFWDMLEDYPEDYGAIKIQSFFKFLHNNNHNYFFETLRFSDFSEYVIISIIIDGEIATLLKMFCDISGFKFEKLSVKDKIYFEGPATI